MSGTLQERAKDDPTQPLGVYAGLVVAYNALLVAAAWTAHRAGYLPTRMGARDLALVGLGANKIGRLVANDRVTLPLRARLLDPNGNPTGSGLRRSMGQLVTCPYCIAPWAALGFSCGLVVAPRATRFALGVLGASAIADVIHRGYTWLKSRQQAANQATREMKGRTEDRRNE